MLLLDNIEFIQQKVKIKYYIRMCRCQIFNLGAARAYGCLSTSFSRWKEIYAVVERSPYIKNYLQYVKKGIDRGPRIGIKKLAEKVFEKYNVSISIPRC